MSQESLTNSNSISHGVPTLNVAGPAIDRETERVHHREGREIEAKFFIPTHVAQRLVKGHPFAQIEQRYFKEKKIRCLLENYVLMSPSAQETATRPSKPPEVLAPEKFSSARIRRICAPGELPDYFLEFKGSKEGFGDLRISRRELSLCISSAEYELLKGEATAGTLHKLRYAFPGTITVNGQMISAVAQVDCLQAAGKKLHNLKDNFSTADIELLDLSHIHAVRAGQHSFTFLEHCIELSAFDKKLWKPLTTRRLAKKGLRDAAMKALKNLKKLYATSLTL